VPITSPEHFSSLLAPPLRRGFIEDAVDPIFEIAEHPERGRDLDLALRRVSGTDRVPEPREVSRVRTPGDEPQDEESQTGRGCVA
jgi:hypothetical protein